MDSLNPQVKHDTFFGDGDSSFSNMRLPIFLLALALVILYQVRQNRRRDEMEDEEETIAMKIAKKAGGKMNAQTRSELAQIDAMEKSLRGMTKNFGNLGGNKMQMDDSD